MGEDSRTVTAAVTDPAGNTSTATEQLTVDTVAPVARITGGATALTDSATPAIAGTTDAPSGAVVTVTLADETLTSAVQSDGTWSVTSGRLADGPHRVVITVTDAAGNVGSAAQTLTITTVATGAAGATGPAGSAGPTSPPGGSAGANGATGSAGTAGVRPPRRLLGRGQRGDGGRSLGQRKSHVANHLSESRRPHVSPCQRATSSRASRDPLTFQAGRRVQRRSHALIEAGAVPHLGGCEPAMTR